jgi:hypothetical protein
MPETVRTMRTITRSIILAALALNGMSAFASQQASRAARLDVRDDGGVSIFIGATQQRAPVAQPPRVAPPADDATAAAVAPAGVELAVRTPTPLNEWTDDWFDADTYPSLKSAASKLGTRWARGAAERLDQQVREIDVHYKRNVSIDVAHEVRAGIASALSNVTVRLAGDQCTNSESVHCLSVSVNEHDEHNPELGSRKGGVVLLESPAFTVSATFTEKPWVDGFSDFVNARPGGSWLIALSKDPCLSEGEAQTSALESAAEQLYRRVREHVRDRVWSPRDDDRLRARIVHELQTKRSLVPDRFLQRAQKSYGGVFRQALLVDASGRNLNYLIELTRGDRLEHRQSIAGVLISAAALFLVVYLLYLFVNSMTRGYFAWSLRMVAVAVVVLGMIVLLLVG